MDDAGPARIEHDLGVRLPRNYAQALASYPFPDRSFTAEFLLWNDPQLLIESNRNVRSMIEGARSSVIPEGRLFQIGHDGGEQAYLIDLAQHSSPIYVLDFETGAITEQCAGLESWLLHCRNCEAAIRADEERMARIAAHKRWWEFWR